MWRAIICGSSERRPTCRRSACWRGGPARFERLRAVADAAVELDPKKLSVLLLRLDVARAERDGITAERLLLRAREIAPDVPSVVDDLAAVRVDFGTVADALDDLTVE